MEITKFLQEIDNINDSIKLMNDSVDAVEKLHLTIRDTSNPRRERELLLDLDDLTLNTNQIANMIRKKLMQIDKDIKRTETQEDEQDESSSTIRWQRKDLNLCKTQCTSMTKKFSKAISKYQKSQINFKNAERKRLERQYKIVHPEATPEEIDRVLNNDSSDSTQIFIQRMLTRSKQEESDTIMQETKERHQNIKRLAKSIQELQQLYMDMQNILEEQDEIMIIIGEDIEAAKDDGSNAHDEVRQAVIDKHQARRKWIYLSCFIFVLLLICIMVIYFTYIHPLVMQNEQKTSAENQGSNIQEDLARLLNMQASAIQTFTANSTSTTATPTITTQSILQPDSTIPPQ